MTSKTTKNSSQDLTKGNRFTNINYTPIYTWLTNAFYTRTVICNLVALLRLHANLCGNFQHVICEEISFRKSPPAQLSNGLSSNLLLFHVMENQYLHNLLFTAAW